MISPSIGYCADIVSSQWLLSGHMSTQYVLYGYVCSVCTELTVVLVSLIVLGIVSVLVDTSAQIKVTKARTRPDWTQQARQQAVILAFFPAATTVCLWMARMFL